MRWLFAQKQADIITSDDRVAGIDDFVLSDIQDGLAVGAPAKPGLVGGVGLE